MKILLVQPRPEDGVGFPNLSRIEPLGLEIIGAALKEYRDYQVHILDLFTEKKFPKLLLRHNPDVIGISCSFTVDVFRTLFLSRIIKENLPGAFVFVGGHHASLQPADFAVPSIDAVVIGEGETTVPELVRCLDKKDDISSVRGLALYDHVKKKQFFTPMRSLLEDLDNSPKPDRSLTKRYRSRYFHGFKRPLATVETSRGCPYRCIFCSVWRFYRNTIRYKSPAVVAEEIKSIREKDIFIVDDNFFSRPARSLAIAEMLGSRPKKTYIIQARSDTIVKHPELLEAWSDCGLDSIFIGFEKIDASGLQEVEKKNTIYNNEKALEMAREKGIRVYASFIVDPGFSNDDFKKLGDYIRRWRIRFPYFSVLTPLPGTKLYDLREKELTTNNWELFDFLHPVLPTKLSLENFYQELTNLYRLGYTGSVNTTHALFMLREFLRTLFRDHHSVEHLSRVIRGCKMMVRPHHYLEMRMK